MFVDCRESTGSWLDQTFIEQPFEKMTMNEEDEERDRKVSNLLFNGQHVSKGRRRDDGRNDEPDS